MRTILHSDCNNFYASVECAYSPSLRGKPIAVCGDPEARHGIVLAKSEEAKKCGVRTGETIWIAKQKCPDLLIVPPCGEKYVRFSRILRQIYAEYSNQIEPFGLDESWLDVSGSTKNGVEIAAILRRRANEELGISLSIGVSFNKIYAKLGSDMHKPDATTVISPQNYQQKIWPLPVGDLLFIGRSTAHKLRDYGLNTIGDIVHSNPEALHTLLGKNGDTLYAYATGKDETPVLAIDHADDIKSIGNSTTPAFDMADIVDAQRVLYLLCDSVAGRMRKRRMCCRTLTLWLRDTDLHTSTHQMKLAAPTDLAVVLINAAFILLQQSWNQAHPLRSIGIQGSDLISSASASQLTMIPDPIFQRHAILESTADKLCARFGKNALYRGILMHQKTPLRVAPDANLAAANMSAIHGREL